MNELSPETWEKFLDPQRNYLEFIIFREKMMASFDNIILKDFKGKIRFFQNQKTINGIKKLCEDLAEKMRDHYSVMVWKIFHDIFYPPLLQNEEEKYKILKEITPNSQELLDLATKMAIQKFYEMYLKNINTHLKNLRNDILNYRQSIDKFLTKVYNEENDMDKLNKMIIFTFNEELAKDISLEDISKYDEDIKQIREQRTQVSYELDKKNLKLFTPDIKEIYHYNPFQELISWYNFGKFWEGIENGYEGKSKIKRKLFLRKS